MLIHINEQESIYSEYWKPMQDALGESLTEFIRHYLMKDGEIINQRDVYFSLKEIVNQRNVLDYLKELKRFAGYYQKLLYPETETNPAIKRALDRLNRIEVTTAYPFLLSCYNDFDQNKISASEFLSIIKTIENFMIRRFVCNVPTYGLNKIFPQLYIQAKKRHAGSLIKEIIDILQTKGYPKDIEFKSRLKEGKLYGSGDRANKTKLILESIEEYYSHKEQVPFHNLSIEHIMPQTLTEWWQTHLGADWEMTHELLLHNIGNLTLTAYNPELSNDDFESKKQRLSKSHLEINKDFRNKISWKREDIEERSEHLAQIILAIWPYFGDEKADQVELTDVTGTTPKKLWILGQYFMVQSWRDVLERTMNTIAELEPEKFEHLMKNFPRFVGKDKKQFRTARELKNGAFIEVNLSAESIRRFCLQALEEIELTSEDWKVEAV